MFVVIYFILFFCFYFLLQQTGIVTRGVTLLTCGCNLWFSARISLSVLSAATQGKHPESTWQPRYFRLDRHSVYSGTTQEICLPCPTNVRLLKMTLCRPLNLNLSQMLTCWDVTSPHKIRHRELKTHLFKTADCGEGE